MSYSDNFYKLLEEQKKKKKKTDDDIAPVSTGDSFSDNFYAEFRKRGKDIDAIDLNRVQDVVSFSRGQKGNTSVWDEYTKAEDFSALSVATGSKIKDVGWKVWKDAGDSKYDFINNINDYRDTAAALSVGSGQKEKYGDFTKYTFMDDKQISIYNYLYAKHGKEKAEEYLKDIEESLNEDYGTDLYNNQSAVGKSLNWLPGGMINWAEETKQFFSDEELATSPYRYQQQLIQEEAEEISPVLGLLNKAGTNISQQIPNQILALGASSAAAAYGASAILAGTVGKLAGALGTGVSSSGGAYKDALSDGYSEEDARTYSLIVGGLEAGLSYALGGFEGMTGVGTDAALRTISTIESSLLRNIAKHSIRIGSEVGEEELQLWLEPLVRTAVLGEEYDAPTIDEMVETALVTAVSTGVMNAVSDIGDGGRVNGLSVNEAKVVDKVYKEALEEQESNGKKLTAKEKNKIYDRVVEEMKAGRIDTDTIERILGGKTYEGYKNLTEQETSLTGKKKAIEDEIKSLVDIPKEQITVGQDERLKSLRSELEKVNANLGKVDVKGAKSNLFNEVNKLTENDTFLRESYNQREKRGQAFTADLNKYKGKQREAVKRAIDSGVLNDTYRSHELVDTLSRLEAEKGIVFDYTNNKKLLQSGMALKGKTINGFEKDGVVTLNVQSSKAWQSTVGHEITHVLEGTGDAYNSLQSVLFELAESKGEYQSRYDALVELYKGVKGYETDFEAKIKKELTADLVGDYLFSDKAFIDRLVGNRTLFQKIWDEIKYLCKVATGKELTEIEKVNREFDRAWKEHGKVAKEEAYNEEEEYNEPAVNFSISKTEDGTKYVKLDGNAFLKEDGTEMTPSEAYNALVGTQITLEDGDVINFVKKLPDVRLYHELFRKYPGHDGSVDIKPLNEAINKNIVDVFAVSNAKERNEKQIHEHEGIVDFDLREVYIADDSSAYRLELYVANLTDGSKAAYVKRYVERADPETAEKIKKAETVRQTHLNQPSNVEGVKTLDTAPTDGSVAQIPENVNTQFSLSSDSEGNIKDVSTDYAYGETYYTMSYEQDGKVVGTLEYGEFEGQPNVKMIQVLPEYRRKGIGTKLLQELQKKYPDQEIDFGMATPDGTKLLESITYDVTDDSVVADRQKLKDLQSELDELQEKLDVLYDTENLTEAQEAEMHRLGDRWEEVYQAINELEPTLRGKKASKTFVRTDNTQYSLSPETDAEYMSAVERGDTETAQKLVDEAARNSMPNSKVRDENGELHIVYHGSPSKFTVFDHNKLNAHGNAHGRGFYFTEDRSLAEGYEKDGGQLLKGYLNIEKPLSEEKVTIKKADLVKLIKATCESEAQLLVNEGGYDNVREAVLDTWVSNYVDTYGTNINDVYREVANIIYSGNENDVDIIAEITNSGAGNEIVLKKTHEVLGYDGVIYTNEMTGKHEYVALVSNQFKSAEPITYDDDGNVIPLSERFNSAHEDIRHSLSNEGEEFAPTGDYSTPLRETALEGDIAPVQEVASKRDVAPVVTGTNVGHKTADNPVVNPEAENAPVEEAAQTVDEKISAKLKNLRTELDNNLRLRGGSNADFDSEIARLQAEYEAKKNKNTKVANDILRRIERIQRLKGNVDADYQKRITGLKERIQKMQTPQYKRGEQRRAKQEKWSNEIKALIGDTSTWVDKKLGIFYQTNTLRRNLRDVVRDANGNRDIAKADAIYEYLQGSYNHNEALLKRESRDIKQPFADMDINKYESEYIQMLGEFKYNPETRLTLEAVDKYYGEHKDDIDLNKVNKAIEESRKVYDSLFKRVNAVLREMGLKELGYKEGYFPHFTDTKQSWLAKLFNWKTIDTEIPTDIAGITEEFNPVRTYQSFDKHRKSDETDYNFLKGFDTYVHGALDWIYHIEDIQKRRAFENEIRYSHSEQGTRDKVAEIINNKDLDSDEVQALLDKVYEEAKNPLNNFVTDLRNSTNNLAGKKSTTDRSMEYATNRKVYSTMTNISNRVSANMVVGSVSSALTNFIPITQSWGQVNPVSSLRAVGDVVRNAINNDGMIEKSDFMTNRLLNEENLDQTGWDKASKVAGGLMNIFDHFTTEVVWRSKFIENMSNGMSESEAIHDADIFAENVMAGRSRGNMPTIYNSKNPITKMLTAFQLEVGNQYGYMFKDLPQDVGKDNISKLTAGYAKMFIGAYVYNALFSKLTGRDAAFDPIGILEDLLKDLGFGDDDEEEEVDVLGAVQGFGENIVQEIPYVGGLLGGGRIPISSALPYDSITKMVSGTMTDIAENDWENLTNEWLNPVYYLALPFGGGQLKKTNEGLAMFSDDHPVSGSYTASGNLRFPVEDTPLNRTQAALFGQYASENAREYFDNDYAPLKEKQIQEYIDVDIPIKDYWEYREGLKKQDTLEDKFDYIAGLDLPVEKKNILINNVVDRKDKVDLGNYDDFSSLEEFDFATKSPDKYAIAKTVGGYSSYKQYASDLNDIKADRDEYGKTISGSRKEKVIQYINGLNADYETKIILYKSEYPSDDTYNADIINYVNGRADLTYEERVAILTELGFRVVNGNIYAD